VDTKLKNFLVEKIKNNNITISIVGLGYVGLPLCLLFAKKIATFGIDKSINKISNFKKNIDLNKQSTVKDFIKAKKVFFSSKFDSIKESQAIIVCLPTPIDTNHKPDLKILREAIVNIAKKIVRNSIIIFDQLYNYIGWEYGEYKSLIEVFNENEYEFKAFQINSRKSVIQIK
jgi:UDP-N-acetyl-D-mannosaminuronate dehydrogenase